MLWASAYFGSSRIASRYAGDGPVQVPLVLQGDPQVVVGEGELRVEPDGLPERGDGPVQVPLDPAGRSPGCCGPPAFPGWAATAAWNHRTRSPAPSGRLIGYDVAQGHEQPQVPGPGPEGDFEHRPPPVRRDRRELAEDGREPGRLGQGLRPPGQVGHRRGRPRRPRRPGRRPGTGPGRPPAAPPAPRPTGRRPATGPGRSAAGPGPATRSPARPPPPAGPSSGVTP